MLVHAQPDGLITLELAKASRRGSPTFQGRHHGERRACARTAPPHEGVIFGQDTEVPLLPGTDDPRRGPPRSNSGRRPSDRDRDGHRRRRLRHRDGRGGLEYALPPRSALQARIRQHLRRRPAADFRCRGCWNEFVARYHYLGYKPLVGAADALRRPRRVPPAGPPAASGQLVPARLLAVAGILRSLSIRFVPASACTAIRLGTIQSSPPPASDRSETCQLDEGFTP